MSSPLTTVSRTRPQASAAASRSSCGTTAGSRWRTQPEPTWSTSPAWALRPHPTWETTLTHPQPQTDPAQQQQTQPPTQPPPAQPPTPPQPAQQPTPATVWPPAQPAPQQPAPTYQAPPPVVQPPAPAQQGGENDFPANTPVAEMTAPQQIAYWKHHARKHEQRVQGMSDYDALKATAEKYTQLVAASQTETERAVAEARRQGRTEALTEAGSELVDQWMRAAADHARVPQESVDALLPNLDRTKFLNPQGGVDTDKVLAFVRSALAPSGTAPAVQQQAPPSYGAPNTGQQQPPAQPQPLVANPPRVPDFGQGQQPVPPRVGLEAGRERARARFAPKTAPAQ